MDFQADRQKKKDQFQEDHSKIDCKSKEIDILNIGDTFFSQKKDIIYKNLLVEIRCILYPFHYMVSENPKMLK